MWWTFCNPLCGLRVDAQASKTCGNFGLIHYKLIKSKEFKCIQCQIKTDIDIYTAWNIHSQHLTINIDKKLISSAKTPRMYNLSRAPYLRSVSLERHDMYDSLQKFNYKENSIFNTRDCPRSLCRRQGLSSRYHF